jgi:hypothetical protein
VVLPGAGYDGVVGRAVDAQHARQSRGPPRGRPDLSVMRPPGRPSGEAPVT